MNRIKELRTRYNISQKQMSIDLGIAQPIICQWEKGIKNMSLSRAVIVADYFDVSVDYLIGASDFLAFPLRLKELRKSLSLSQQSFADKIGIRQSTVAMWENGSNFPRKTTLAHIAAFFNVSVDYLMGVSMNRIKEIRISKGISQKALSIDLNVSQATISKWEIGIISPSTSNAVRLAEYFNVPLDYLMGISDDPGDPKPASAPADDINDQLRFALFNGENIDLDDAALDEIRAYARFKYEQQKNGRK